MDQPTRGSMVAGLHPEADDPTARNYWAYFAEAYGPYVEAVARAYCRGRLCLPEATADDLARETRQEVLTTIRHRIARYDPAVGRFRAWLTTVTRNAVLTLRTRWSQSRGDSAVARLVEGVGSLGLDEQGVQRFFALLEQAVAEVLDDKSPAERAACRQLIDRLGWEDLRGHREVAVALAEELGVTPTTLCKRRERLRNEVRAVLARLLADDALTADLAPEENRRASLG